MRVVVCPDKFAGTLSAPEAASAIAAGWLAGVPEDTVTVRPLADGGPGFLDVLSFIGGARTDVPTVDPLGSPVAGWVLVDGTTAYVESAQACGLHLVPGPRRDPTVTTTYGVGVLVAAAVEAGVRTVVLGLGGSATNDGGAGLLSAPEPPCRRRRIRPPVQRGRTRVLHRFVRGAGCSVLLVGASDVDSPLCGPAGASGVYGPQKGAAPGQVSILDAALVRFAAVLEASLPGCPPGLANLPGAGAAGGLGAAILACGGQLTSGFGMVSSVVGLGALIDGCDLVITGEGSFDDGSLRGKVVSGVAAAARDRGLPCVVLAGRVAVGRAGALAAGISESYSLIEHFGDEATALARPEDGLRALAGRLARQFHAHR
jgi:glycerate kinase